MPKVKCLGRLANTLAGETIVTPKDDTICKVLRKMGENLHYIPDDSTLLHDINDVVLHVKITQLDTNVYTCDKTIAEMVEANAAGKILVGHLGLYVLQPSQISESLCYFYSEVMATSSISQRASVSITPTGIGVVLINHQLVPPDTPDTNDPPAA